MASWVDDLADDVVDELYVKTPWDSVRSGLRRAIEEAARRCIEADTKDEADNGAAMTGGAQVARELILGMLTDDEGSR